MIAFSNTLKSDQTSMAKSRGSKIQSTTLTKNSAAEHIVFNEIRRHAITLGELRYWQTIYAAGAAAT
jgi:hypothetical protein